MEKTALHCAAILLKKIIGYERSNIFRVETIISIFLCFIILVPRASCSLSRRGLSRSTGPVPRPCRLREQEALGTRTVLYWLELTTVMLTHYTESS